MLKTKHPDSQTCEDPQCLLVGTENRHLLLCILILDFKKAVLSCGSTAPADAKQPSGIILLCLQDAEQSGPRGVSSLEQLGPFSSWQSFNSVTKLTSAWASEVDD